MKKILAGLGIILFFIVAALILIPAFMNWSSYKEMISSKIKEYTQLDVAIDGKIKLRLFPTPAFAVQKVRLKSPSTCREGDFLSLESIETHLSLMSLIRGKIDVSSLHLIHPHLAFDTAETCIYPFSTLATPSLGGDTPSVKLSELQIEEGDITIYKGAAEAFALKNLSFEASFDDLMGPYTLKGEGKYLNQDAEIDIRIGRLALENTPLTLKAQLGDDEITLKGQADLLSGTPRLQGKINAEIMHEDSLLAKAYDSLPKALQAKMNIEGDVVLSKQGAEIQNLAFHWDKLHGTGALAASFDKIPALTGEIKLQPFVLDDYLRFKTQKTKTAFLFKEAYAADPLQTNLPQSFNLKLTVIADHVNFQEAALTQSQATFALTNGLLAVEHIQLGLPFSGKASGSLSFTPDWGYQGNISLDLPQFTPYLIANGHKPLPGIFKKLSVVTQLKGDRNSATFTRLKATLDNSTLQGEGLLRFSDYGLAGKFHVDQLNLTPYLALAALRNQPRFILAAQKKSSLPPLNIDARCDQLTYKDKVFTNCHTGFILENDQLTFSNLSGLKDGLTFEASGKVNSISQQMTLDMNGAVKGHLQDIGDIKAAANFSGPLEKLGTVGSFFVYGASGQFEGSFNALKPEEEIQGTLKVTHPEAGFLFGDREGMGAFSFETKLVTLNKVMSLTKLKGAIGRLGLSGNASLDFNHDRPFVTTNLDLGNIKLSQLNAEYLPRIIRVADRSPEKPFSKEPFNMNFWNAFDGKLNFTAKEFSLQNVPFSNLIVQASLNRGQLTTQTINAALFGGNLSGNVNFLFKGTPQLSSNFNLHHMNLKTAQDFFDAGSKLSGLLSADLTLQGRGVSPYALMSSLNGQANVNIEQGLIHGLDLNALKAKLEKFDDAVDILSLLKTIKKGGQTPLHKAGGTFQIQNGQATTDNAIITCEAGTGYLRGRFILPEKTMDMQAEFKLASQKDFPNLHARFYGPWGSPSTDFDTSMLKSFVLGKSALSLAPGKEAKKKRKKKILENLLEEILPEDQQEAPAPKEKFDGKELVNDLLQGLLK